MQEMKHPYPVGTKVTYTSTDSDCQVEAEVIGYFYKGSYAITWEPNDWHDGYRMEAELHEDEIPPQYQGRRMYWALPRHLTPILKKEIPTPSCVRCHTPSYMSEPNLQDATGKVVAFACFSCRSTLGWWLREQGLTPIT